MQLTLSPLEEDVANLLQFPKRINPVQGVKCQSQYQECDIAFEKADRFVWHVCYKERLLRVKSENWNPQSPLKTMPNKFTPN